MLLIDDDVGMVPVVDDVVELDAREDILALDDDVGSEEGVDGGLLDVDSVVSTGFALELMEVVTGGGNEDVVDPWIGEVLIRDEVLVVGTVSRRDGVVSTGGASVLGSSLVKVLCVDGDSVLSAGVAGIDSCLVS